MSYLTQAQDPRRRAAAIALTTAVHAALGLGLVVGLTVTGVTPAIEIWNPIPLTPDPEPEPLPPEPQRQQQTEETFITVPPTPLEALVTKPTELDVRESVVEQREFVVDRGPIVPPVLDPPRATFAPKPVRPRNSPARWITNDDYPPRALIDEAEGVAAYRLIVGTSGQVTACEVTRSTGNGPLDDATCRFIERRARFEAATDENGAKVMGSYTGTVRWDIPE
jgi:protein TonB